MTFYPQSQLLSGPIERTTCVNTRAKSTLVGLGFSHTLCPPSCPALTPGKWSCTPRASSHPAHSSWPLLAPSSFNSPAHDPQSALPTYTQPQLKITHPVTACRAQTTSVTLYHLTPTGSITMAYSPSPLWYQHSGLSAFLHSCPHVHPSHPQT